MPNTKKGLSERDHQQVLKHAHNDVNGTIGVDGFLVGKVGHKVVRSVITTTVTDDTEVFEFSDSGTSLYTLHVVYTDGTLETLISVERIA